MRLKSKLKKKKTEMEVGGYVRRITLVSLLLTVFLGVCLAKVGYLQLVKGTELAQGAESWQMDTLDFYAKRGKILDRNGNVLAMSVETQGIQIFRPALKDPDYVVDYISGILAIDRKTASRRVLCKSKYCYASRAVDPKIAEPLRAVLAYRGDDPQLRWQKAKLSGVQVVPAAARLYPFGETAGQVVGIARTPAKGRHSKYPSPMELEGQYGMEAACDDMLMGKPVVQKGLKRQKQSLSLLAENPDLVLAGNSVLLTIDVNIQSIAEEELRRAVITSLARRGIAMVMEVRTGELLAVAHYPPFNPNGSSRYTGDEIWKWNDSAFSEIFEPGSTVKPLIAAAALEEGVIRLDDLVFCENGSWKVTPKEKPIEDHGKHEFLTIWDCLKFSSNICMGKIGLKLGPKKLYSYLKEFGFGARTGVKPNNREARGLINKQGKNWSSVEIANISFGQGIAVTGVQLLAAVASLGNHGRLMKPILLKELMDGSGKTLVKYEPSVVRQVVSAKNARLVIDAMRRVLDPDGTGHRGNVFGFETCGKTGTAQKVMTVADPYWEEGGERKRPARRSVYVDKWIASFVGLVPADRPRLAIIVAVDEPYLSHEGGIVAAPVFSRIGSRTLTYLNEVPAQETRHHTAEVDAINPAGTVAEIAEVAKSVPQPTPGGVGPAVVPDFSGMSVADALRIGWQSRVKLVANGAGFAVSQDPEPQAVVPEWGEVRVRFNANLAQGRKEE